MNILKSTDTKLKKTNTTKLYAIMDSSNYTPDYAGYIGMLKTNSATKYLIGNFMFLLPIKTSKKLGI